MEKGVTSPSLEAFGYLWELEFYPNGYKSPDTDVDTGYISVFLTRVGDDKYAPSARFVIRCKEYEHPFKTYLFSKEQMWGKRNYLKRNDVLENCLEEDGSLIIEVDIQITVDSKRVWYPQQIPTETSLKQLFVDVVSSSNRKTEEELENDTTDIVFIAGKDEFPVHKFVLSLHAKTLFAFYKERMISSKKRKRSNHTGTDDNDDDDDDDRVRVIIPDMNSVTFQKVLEYIYTVNTTPTLLDAAAAIELLLAAHRFECSTLQLYVESVLVDKFVTPTNTASMLLLGDSHSCALLKEAAWNMYVADPKTVKGSNTEDWNRLKESNDLLEELLVYTSNKLVATRNPTTTPPTAVGDTQNSAGGTNNATASSTGTEMNAGAVAARMVVDDCSTMDVGTLREHLDDANLALDGSREVLVHRLRDYRQHQQHT
jgi:hypothetical protein